MSQFQPPPLSSVAPIITACAALIAAFVGLWNKFDINSVKKTGEATHVLSNSAMGEQLLGNVELLTALSVQGHRLAEITKQEADFASASALDVKVEAAKALWQKHVTQQAIVDAKTGK